MIKVTCFAERNLRYMSNAEGDPFSSRAMLTTSQTPRIRLRRNEKKNFDSFPLPAPEATTFLAKRRNNMKYDQWCWSRRAAPTREGGKALLSSCPPLNQFQLRK